jgi:hypoxanthine phosphoribosyltransferase
MARLSGVVLQDLDAIEARVTAMGKQIARDFEGRELTVLGVLNGAFVFTADLIRRIPLSLSCGFVEIRPPRRPGGTPEILLPFSAAIEGRDVLLVEDILDTGATLNALQRHLLAHRPSRLTTCVLLDKPARRREPFKADYVGFEVPDTWVVGYGLDHEGLYRNLPYLTSIEAGA